MRKKKLTTEKEVLAYVKDWFAFIDKHPEKPQVKRVNEILGLLVEVERLRRSGGRDTPHIKRLQEIFREYRWTREISWEDGRVSERIDLAEEVPPDKFDECGAVHILLVLAKHYPKYLSNIRKCDECGIWMIARRPTVDRFCTVPGRNCRQLEYDNDPKRQEQHRASMKRLYRKKKDEAEREDYKFALDRGFRGTIEQWREVKKAPSPNRAARKSNHR